MNNNTKIWKVSVGLLTLLNIALILTIWLRPGPGPERMHGPPREGAHTADFITEQLKFSEKQVAEFNKLKKEHRDSVEKLLEQGHELRDSFFAQLKTDSADQKKVEEYSLAIANNQKAIEFITVKHFEQVRKLCDANQKAIFDEIIDDVLRKMARGPGGKPPRGPHP